MRERCSDRLWWLNSRPLDCRLSMLMIQGQRGKILGGALQMLAKGPVPPDIHLFQDVSRSGVGFVQLDWTRYHIISCSMGSLCHMPAA